MSTIPHALTTKTKVKTFLGETSSTYDTAIDEIINYVTDYIEGMVGRRFLSTTYTNEVYDTRLTQRIFLKNYPVTTLTTVEYRSGAGASPTWNTYDTNGYLLYGKEGYVYFYGRLPAIKQGMRFTYVAGFLIDFANENIPSLHTLPFDITMVATELTAKIFGSRKAQGITNMTTEGQSITFSGDVDANLTSAHKTIIGSYSAHRFSL